MPRMAKKKPVRRRKKVTARSVGLSAPETADVQEAATRALASDIGATVGRCSPSIASRSAARPRCWPRCRSIASSRRPTSAIPPEPHVKRLMTVIEKLGRFLDPIIAVAQDERLLDAERQPPPAGDAQARREVGRRAGRARCRRRVQDPRAQHREGAQPEGEVARDDPDAARARRRAGPRDRARVRLRVRPAALPDPRRRLRAAPAPERRRLQSGAAPHRGLPRRPAAAGAEGARAARRRSSSRSTTA